MYLTGQAVHLGVGTGDAAQPRHGVVRAHYLSSSNTKNEQVTRLKLHYDGWLALPPAFRRELSLSTGGLLEAELVDGAIVLRPVVKATSKAKAAAAPGPEQAANEDRAGEPTLATRRKPGRPRKASPAAERSAPTLNLEPGHEPAPRTEEAARSELRRKGAPPAPDLEQTWALVRDPRPERRGHDGHGEREKLPFRRVEVRKLGPGRGHNRDRLRVSGAPIPRS